MATRPQVEAKLAELIRRLDGAGGDVHDSLADSLPDGRVIEVSVTDLGHSYWTEMRDGRMTDLRSGAPEVTHIRIRVGSDHLVELVDGKRSLFSAYLAGQVKIEAGFSDLLKLRRLA